MSARTQLAAALTSGLPAGYRVVGSPVGLDSVTRPTVCVWQQALGPLPAAPDSKLQIELTLWVLTGFEDPDRADDALDDALVDVLGVLDAQSWLTWDRAERGVLSENFHGYSITLSAFATKEP